MASLVVFFSLYNTLLGIIAHSQIWAVPLLIYDGQCWRLTTSTHIIMRVVYRWVVVGAWKISSGVPNLSQKFARSFALRAHASQPTQTKLLFTASKCHNSDALAVCV